MTTTTQSAEQKPKNEIASYKLETSKEETVKMYEKHLKNIGGRSPIYPLEEAVYQLMGGHFYIDNIREYKSAIVAVLLKLVDEPGIKEKIGYQFSTLIDMLEAMYDFTEVMNDHYFKVLLHKQNIICQDHTQDELLEYQQAIKQLEDVEHHAMNYLC